MLYGRDRVSHYVGTNAFVYADDTGQRRVVQLETPPRNTVIGDHHVFFQMQTNTDEQIFDVRRSDLFLWFAGSMESDNPKKRELLLT